MKSSPVKYAARGFGGKVEGRCLIAEGILWLSQQLGSFHGGYRVDNHGLGYGSKKLVEKALNSIISTGLLM
jgi:hypothetical protein